MNKLLHLGILLSSITLGVSAENTTTPITTLPEGGRVVEYYADFLNYDNLFDFMGDYHSIQKIMFADNGDVYLPNMLMRNIMKSYVKGTYDAAAGTITVAPGQPVYVSPNTQSITRLYALDGAAFAGDTITNKFYDNNLVFKVADDGTISLEIPEKRPFFGVCDESSVSAIYGMGSGMTFTPVANVTDRIQFYDYKYVNDTDNQTYTTTASGYIEGATAWMKGFNPKYPEAWCKATKVGDEFRAASFQVVYYSMYDQPIVMASAKRTLNAQYEEEFTAYNYLPIAINTTTGEITACQDDMLMVNLTSYDEQSIEFLQAYKKLSFTPRTIDASTPANPEFYSYDFYASSKETEFIFTAKPTDTAGNTLVADALYFRFYIDGKTYTFTSALYPKFSEDVTLVPYSTDLYGTVMQGNNNKRYVYFQELPADTKTIGVETVYIVDGKEHCSQRLVYDIASSSSSYEDNSGITSAITTAEIESIRYYDLNGREVKGNANGILIRMTRRTDGSVSTEKVIVKP